MRRLTRDALDAEIVEILEKADKRGNGMNAVTMGGYLDFAWTDEAVSAALQRLKRRGVLVSAGTRGWYRLPDRVSS